MDFQKLEDAICLAAEYFSKGGPYKKPTLLHSIRVGLFLFRKGYSLDVAVGGILHDMIEDTTIQQSEIEEKFGGYVLQLVQANTKDISVPKEELNRELIFRCASVSEEALIIKSADVIDNYEYYSYQDEENGVLRCTKLANLILEAKGNDSHDPIFASIQQIAGGTYMCKYFE